MTDELTEIDAPAAGGVEPGPGENDGKPSPVDPSEVGDAPNDAPPAASGDPGDEHELAEPAATDGPTAVDTACVLCGGLGVLMNEPRQSPRYMTCDECDGFGDVLTGSRTEESFLAPCEGCNGRGYKPNPEFGGGGVLVLADSGTPPAPGMERGANGEWGYPGLTA